MVAVGTGAGLGVAGFAVAAAGVAGRGVVGAVVGRGGVVVAAAAAVVVVAAVGGSEGSSSTGGADVVGAVVGGSGGSPATVSAAAGGVLDDDETALRTAAAAAMRMPAMSTPTAAAPRYLRLGYGSLRGGYSIAAEPSVAVLVALGDSARLIAEPCDSLAVGGGGVIPDGVPATACGPDGITEPGGGVGG